MPHTHSGNAADLLSSLRRLSDGELVARVRKLATRERRATALLVAHLAELDTRDVHLREGYSSLFSYCLEVLALSEHEAYNRIEVARAARRFPVVLDLLAVGSVNLTAVRLLAPHLTPENHRAVLESARGKRKAQIEEIVARLLPKPDAPASIRKVSAPHGVEVGAATSNGAVSGAAVSASTAATTAAPVHGPQPTIAPVSSPGTALPARPAPPGTIAPLAPGRYRLQVTLDGATVEKLRLAKDMLRHAVPSGDEAEILDRALTTLLTDLARKKFAATEKPRPSRRSADGSRYIPAEVRRTVWLRDLGRCAFVGKTGRRCSERAFVELHHLRPHEIGGEATAENIELRCRRHNDYEARVFFDRGDTAGGTTLAREPAETYDAAGAATRSRTSRPFTRGSPNALLLR